MDARELILTELHDYCRYENLRAERDGFTWDDQVFLRTAIIRIQQGDDSAWSDFTQRLKKRSCLSGAVRVRLEDRGYLYYDFANDRWLPGLFPPQIEKLRREDADALIASVQHDDVEDVICDEPPTRRRSGRSGVMYIEYKGDSLTGPACIGRVTLSQSRKTIYYQQRKFQSLKGVGYKANFCDVQNGGWYWISKCRKDGQDTLYPGTVNIDEDVREEYWTMIRQRPDLMATTSFRSEGKYSRRRPQPEKPHRAADGPR